MTRKKKPVVITLASGTVMLNGSGANEVAVPLTKQGKHVLTAHHGRLAASVLVVDMTPAGPQQAMGPLMITRAKRTKA